VGGDADGVSKVAKWRKQKKDNEKKELATPRH